MSSNQVQLLGGSYQDAEGNVLNHGKLVFELNQDSQITGGGQVAAGLKIEVGLDSQGDVFGTNTVAINSTSMTGGILSVVAQTNIVNFVAVGDIIIFPPSMSANWLSNQSVVVTSVSNLTFTANFIHGDYSTIIEIGKSYTVGNAIFMWPNDVLNPAGSLYTVFAYTSIGQEAWGPFYGAIFSPGPFSLDSWVPGGTGTGGVIGSILLQTNGVNNGNQNKENLFSGDGSVTLTDDGFGNIDIRSLVTPGGAVLLNPSADQTINGAFNLNISDGSVNVTGLGTASALGSTSLLNLSIDDSSAWNFTMQCGGAAGGFGAFVDENGDVFFGAIANDGTPSVNQFIFRGVANGSNIRIGEDGSHGIGIDSNGNVLIGAGGAPGGLGGPVLGLDEAGVIFPSSVLNGAYVQLLGSNNRGQLMFQFPNLAISDLATGTFTILAESSAPATASSAGKAGQFARDSNFLYSCVAANTWKRVAIATW